MKEKTDKEILLALPRVLEVYVDGIKVSESRVPYSYPFDEDDYNPEIPDNDKYEADPYISYNRLIDDYYKNGYESVTSCKGGLDDYNVLFNKNEMKSVCICTKMRFDVSDIKGTPIYCDSVLRPAYAPDSKDDEMRVIREYYSREWKLEKVHSRWPERYVIESLDALKCMIVVR